MSRSIDLFIDADVPLEELAGTLGAACPQALEPDSSGARYRLRDEAVLAELALHAYRDDGDLWLSRYRYALSCRVPDDARPQDTAETALLRRVAAEVRRRDLFPVLLVVDLQYREEDGSPAGDAAALP